jgi:transaldolase
MDIFNQIDVYADGAALQDIPALIEKFPLRGFTTNPTLMAQAGVRDYLRFARQLLEQVAGKPVSFEVFADDFAEMRRQAHKLAQLAENVYVKIPVTNTLGESAAPLIRDLTQEGIKINVTAVFTPSQIDGLVASFTADVPGVLSIFAGRIADAGVDPCPTMKHGLSAFQSLPKVQVLWASCREIYNVAQAAATGCHIVTVPLAMLGKLATFGKDLTEFSLDTVKMFRKDALASGLSI